mgnify:CR=1 FL=1
MAPKERVYIYENGENGFSFIHMLIEIPKVKAKACELIDGSLISHYHEKKREREREREREKASYITSQGKARHWGEKLI